MIYKYFYACFRGPVESGGMPNSSSVQVLGSTYFHSPWKKKSLNQNFTDTDKKTATAWIIVCALLEPFFY